MTLPWVHLDGRLVRAQDARVSPFDRGFLLGDGLFETLRAYRGKPALLPDHLARLARGCEALRLPFPDDLPARVDATLDANGRPDAAVRVTLTRGPGGRGASPRGAGPGTILVSLAAIPYDEAIYSRGLRAVVSRRVHAPEGHAGIKATSYVDHVLARLEADDAGADEALFADPAGHLLEATQANLFALRGDVLTTPPLGALLPGVTRRAILELAGTLGLRAREAPLTREDLLGSDEGWLTASVLEVAPLTTLDGAPIGRGVAGPWAAKMRQAYRIHAQKGY